jgi:hypothetical protein
MTESQLDKLYDYTKFHIGVYTGLIAALAAVLAKITGLPHELAVCIKITLVCFCLAGICGGIIGSTISVDKDDLLRDKPVGPWCLKIFTAKGWAHLEHGCFWLGILVSVVAILTTLP